MTKLNLKIGIIGIGNMGSSIYKALVDQYEINSIFACDRNKSKVKTIESSQTIFDTDTLIRKADVIILAIKPQSLDEFLECLNLEEYDQKVFISIMAGVTLHELTKKLKTEFVVRAMPNLAIKTKHGVTGWIANSAMNNYQMRIVREILESMGHTVEVQNEDMIDKITAISGSGPAYFYYLAEIMQKQAEEFGFSAIQSKMIVNQTLKGAGITVDNITMDIGELREAVTSKGGTTEAALKKFKKLGFEKTIIEGIKSAHRKAKKLGKK